MRTGRAHLVTQRPFLPAGTLRDALRLGNDAADPELWDALRRVGLEGFVASLPEALGTPLGDDGFGLSAGQRSRVALARATLSTAPVLLVDEPTAHLDPASAELVHDVLLGLAERRDRRGRDAPARARRARRPARRADPHGRGGGVMTRRTVLAGLLGGAATASGIALTATSGWLIVRASEQPVILTLLTAIVAVRAFGIARPFFRYLERLVSHDAALDDLAVRRTAVYAALVPLTPARLGRRSRSRVLTGVVDDLTDVTEAQVRVTVPVLSSAVAGLVATLLVAWFSPAVGLVLVGLLLAVTACCLLAWWVESRSRDELLEARAEVVRVSDLVARQATELQAIGAEATASGWLADAHGTLRAAVRRQSRGRGLVAAFLLLGTAVATLAAARLADPATVGGPVAALLVVVPVAVGDALSPLVDTMRSLARAQGSRARLDALLDQQPAVHEPEHPAQVPDGGAGRHVALAGVAASWTGGDDQVGPTDLDLPPGRRRRARGPERVGQEHPPRGPRPPPRPEPRPAHGRRQPTCGPSASRTSGRRSPCSTTSRTCSRRRSRATSGSRRPTPTTPR